MGEQSVVQFVAARERPWTGRWASLSKEWSPPQKLQTWKEVEWEKFKYEEERQRENEGGVVRAVTFRVEIIMQVIVDLVDELI